MDWRRSIADARSRPNSIVQSLMENLRNENLSLKAQIEAKDADLAELRRLYVDVVTRFGHVCASFGLDSDAPLEDLKAQVKAKKNA